MLLYAQIEIICRHLRAIDYNRWRTWNIGELQIRNWNSPSLSFVLSLCFYLFEGGNRGKHWIPRDDIRGSIVNSADLPTFLVNKYVRRHVLTKENLAPSMDWPLSPSLSSTSHSAASVLRRSWTVPLKSWLIESESGPRKFKRSVFPWTSGAQRSRPGRGYAISIDRAKKDTERSS